MKKLFWLFLLWAPVSRAQIRVPRLVGDGMVLQRDMPVRIWGYGSPGEQVTVKFGGETASGVTQNSGRWAVILSPKKAGGPFTMDIDGINHVWVKNIMVGDVFVCAGDETMRFPLEKVRERYAEVIARADRVPIRFFRINKHYDFKGPRQNVASGSWEAASPASALSVSALAYLFAVQVNEHYHVPVGLITAAVADAPAEAWLSPEALSLFPSRSPAEDRYADSSFADGAGPADPMAPGGLFNGMIAPVTPYTVRGVIWAQGDANIDGHAEYQTALSSLIGDWRRHWGEGGLPFLFVQSGAHGPVVQEPAESKWAELRDAQRLTLSVTGTGMAVAADLGEGEEGVPKDLEELAKRMFMASEEVIFEKANVIFTGPLFHAVRIHHERVTVHFDQVESGLIVKGGGELRGFELAGADHRFYPAKATIEGKTVVVTCEQVVNPVSVRYGWADNPQGANLYNRDHLFQDGLPAPSFQATKVAK
jgi:sialate O-acetylesterase